MAALVTAPGPRATEPAGAQPAAVHRAAVIVDTGTEVRRVCVRFTEESLSGIEVLSRAGTDPVLRGFAGKGAAVCSLCGTGCPGDESCLTCDPGGRFWSYSRAPAGAAALRTSGVGASSTTVRDGDVEGWRWGTGGTPPFATVAEVCGDGPVPAPTTTAAPAPPSPPVTAPVPPPTTPPPATAARRPATTGAPAVAATTTPAAIVPPTTVAPPPAGDAAPSAGAAAPTTNAPAAGGAPASSPGGGSTGRGDARGLAAFAAALAGLGAWAAAARRRRRAGG